MATSSGRLGVLLAAALTLALGCERRVAAPPTTPVPPKGDTPEAKLERVIQRLEFALDAAQGSADFGVTSDRACQHKLIAPTDGEPRYTAEVIVATRRTVTAANGKAPAPSAPKEANGKDQPATSNLETEKFLLVYENDRWTLPEKPESETLRLCFESALAEE